MSYINPTWYHSRLQSAGSRPTSISLDYQQKVDDSDNYDAYEYITNNWLNVSRPDLGAGDKVRAVWIAPNFYGPKPIVSQVDLSYAGNGRFTGQLPDTLVGHSDAGGGGDDFANDGEQLAVVVNGDWLTDPISGTHHFQVDPKKLMGGAPG